ncbi:hypothetical protein Tco_0183507 [Tanacetum coccineum]
MGDKNPIHTLGDYSKPSHEGYRNTIELLERNNVVPLRYDTIQLVQNECSFHRLRSEDPNQHLKDFLKLMDLLDLDGHHGESLLEAWTRFKDLLQKFSHHGINLWLQALLEDLTLYDNESWNDPRDFTKPVKAISLPQDVPSTSERLLIELKNQVQCLMEAHIALRNLELYHHFHPIFTVVIESTLKVSLNISYPADFTPGVVVFVFDLQVIFDEKKLGSS